MMKFDRPAERNPIDEQTVVGQPTSRIDGALKTTGQARYAYEQHDVVPDQTYGYLVGAGIARGRIRAIDGRAARDLPGVIEVITWENAGDVTYPGGGTPDYLAGPEIQHYHQAVALVVAESFEVARDGAFLLEISYDRAPGRYALPSLAEGDWPAPDAAREGLEPADSDTVGDFEAAFAAAPVRIEQRYRTSHESHAMMEPHATIAHWADGRLTLWTATQMVGWAQRSLARLFGIEKSDVRVIAPYVGGGFGAKLAIQSDAVLAAIAARRIGRPVKVALTRPMVMNNTTHRSATLQRVRLGAERDGRLTAIAHQGISGNLAEGRHEPAVSQTKLLYAGANRLTAMHMAILDLPKASDMRAPGEAPGLMALEVAMDELAEALGMDPVELRILNDTQSDPADPERPFSERHLVECLRTGAERFGWSDRSATPGAQRDGDWLLGMGMAAGYRDNLVRQSAARIRLEQDGSLTVETDMTDIGTGSYTILAQTAAEMLGVPLGRVAVRLGDSDFPLSVGSGGQWGANNATAGLYAACVRLRARICEMLQMPEAEAQFADGAVTGAGRRVELAELVRDEAISAEDRIEYGDLDETHQQATFAAHFVEAAVNAWTGEVRLRRMLSVCDAGRILNPKTARSQVIGSMTMGIGSALMEELAVDAGAGFFVNHDLAGYEVPVHADLPEQEVIFLDHPDAFSSPMKAKGVGELGLCGVGAAIANALYNATGIRLREYPLTLDGMLERLPPLAPPGP